MTWHYSKNAPCSSQSLLKPLRRLKTKFTLVGIKQDHQVHFIAHQALLIAHQGLLIAQQAHYTALCQPHQRAQDIMRSEAPLSLTMNVKGATNSPGLSTATPNLFCWLPANRGSSRTGNIAQKPIEWLTYLEGVDEWRQYYTEDFPEHYRANIAVYRCKLKKYEVSFSQFEQILLTLTHFNSVASDNYSPASHQKI